jgi:hypothetical protein
MERPTELKMKQAWNGLHHVVSDSSAADDDDEHAKIFNISRFHPFIGHKGP